jgi:hypothetical protein
MVRLWVTFFALLSSQVLTGGPSEALHSLGSEQRRLLDQWYVDLGAPDTGETFGEFLVRAAALKWHSPYSHRKEANGPERLRVDLSRFDCVTLIDTSMAVARCAWRGDTTETCFTKELVASRYRNGTMGDFASRLHYLEDWLGDNQTRLRMVDWTQKLGGLLLRRHFFYMSGHPYLFPPMAELQEQEAIAQTEARLSERIFAVLVRSSVRQAERQLQDGDVVGVVTTEPGRLIGHVGLITHSQRGTPRLLHASSHHRRVIVTRRSLSDYVLRRPDRWGIMVARPCPPGSRTVVTTEDPPL